MPVQPIIQRSFVGGELDPKLGARADLGKYLTGLSTCRNFVVHKHGGVSNRPGTKFVAEVKGSAANVTLIPFLFEAAAQSYIIEAGSGYFRFYYQGAPVVVSGVAAWSGATAYVVGDLVVSGGVNYYCILAHTNQIPPNATYWYPLTDDIYEVPSPYTSGDASQVAWTQSADTLTLAHPSHAPRSLQRLGPTNWVLSTIITTPTIGTPINEAGIAGAAGARTFRYKVTAAKDPTFEESLASATITIAAAADPTVAAPHTLSCDPVTGAIEYYWYADPYNNGVFGFIGASLGPAFSDVGFLPDYTVTPPINRSLFASTSNYPAKVSYHGQRLVFGRSVNQPETVWASKVGAYNNFSISTPIQDDDSVEFVIASTILQPVAHLVGLKKLLVLTDEGEWMIYGDQDGILRPTAINPNQEGYAGAKSDVVPVVVGNSVVYVQARGTVVRELSFDQSQGGFAGQDLTNYSSHLFDGYSIRSMAYARQPHSILWVVRSDGTLLGATYVKEQEVLAWHRHDTGASGVFERIAVLPDNTAGEDVLYAIVKRTIDGSTVRYVEVFASRHVVDVVTDAIFMDATITYSGTPVTTITGLDHLEGEPVAILADGSVISDGSLPAYTVAAGSVTLPAAKAVVHVGIPITYPDVVTLDLDVQGSNIRDKKKRVQGLSALVLDSGVGFYAGPDANNLIEHRLELWQPVPTLMNGLAEVLLTCTYEEKGRVMVRVKDPLPFTLLALMPLTEIGG